MKLVTALLLFVFSYSNAQNEISNHEFKFYKNGKFVKSKKLEIYFINASDTIKVDVVSNEVKMPKLESVNSVLVIVGKNKYLISEVDLSKVNEGSTIIFGVEKNFSNLISVKAEFPKMRKLGNENILLKVENLEQAKEICFLVFHSKVKEEPNKKEYKMYSKMAISKPKSAK